MKGDEMWKELLSAGVVKESVPTLCEKPGEEMAKGGKGLTRSAPSAEWKPVRVLTEYGKYLYDNTFGGGRCGCGGRTGCHKFPLGKG